MDFKLDMANKNGVLFLAFAFLAHPTFANITINGTSYSSGINLNTANAIWTIAGTASGYVQVKQNCTIVLDNVTWTCTDYTTTGSFLTKKYYGYCPIQITSGVTVNLQLKGTNRITPSYSKGNQTGIYVPSGAAVNITNLTADASLIVDASSYSGSTAIGGWAYETKDGGAVTVSGGTLVAKSGENCAGIGGANEGKGCAFTNLNGIVTATGGKYGAGIGGGYKADGYIFNSRGGKTTATGGEGAAGIGGGRSGGDWSCRIDGGYVSATGGAGGAGVGGGRSGEGGTFYNFGGTLYAKRTAVGSGSGTAAADIGSGYDYSGGNAYICRITGGSTGLANGSVTGQQPASNYVARVYRVLVENCTVGKKYVFGGLPESYGQNNIVSDSSGVIHLWLPNGSYEFSDEDYIYTATVNGAKTTATRTAKPTTTTITFKDWDGTTIAEYTDDIGTALTAPTNPTRTGYTFTGWSPEVPSAFPDKDTIYTAQYTANQYTLTFYDEDGTTVLDAITQDCDSAVTAPAPAKAEYIFSGWSPNVPATMPPGNLSFTAKWELAPYFRLVSVIPGADGKVTVKYDSYNTDLTKGDFTLTVKDANGAVAATVTEWETAPSTEAGEQTAVWDAKDFIAALANPADYTFTLSVGAEAEAKYLVIDLSNGSKTYLADVPEGGWTDEYKTTKLVLRKILGEGETATFTMGSPTSEAGRIDNETQHSVTLTKPYWMGVFEFTQGQWAAVKGSSPSCTFSGAARPVETVAWADLKGAITSYGETSATGSSFFGALRSLAGSEPGLNLPTEAEWEYACRAGTTSAFNDGSELTASDTRKSNALDTIAVYDNNSGNTTAVVGTKAPNAWGLYDMHGNVREWCHDQSVERTTDATDLGSAAATDPVASSVSSSSNPYRVTRGGSWYNYANGCRSARRTARFQENGTATVSGESYTGFRVAAREFAGVAKVGSQIDAENTVSATLGKKPRKGFMMMFY